MRMVHIQEPQYFQGRATMTKLLHRLLRNKEAATAIEYGLIAALICIAALGAISSFGSIAEAMWNMVSTKSTTAMNN